MKPQLWYCEFCGVMGALMYAPGSDAMSVVFGMGDQHREASPGCENKAMGLRSIVVENIREPFILRPHESIKR
jgi:hypothetical protein